MTQAATAPQAPRPGVNPTSLAELKASTRSLPAASSLLFHPLLLLLLRLKSLSFSTDCPLRDHRRGAYFLQALLFICFSLLNQQKEEEQTDGEERPLYIIHRSSVGFNTLLSDQQQSLSVAQLVVTDDRPP